MKEDSKKAKHLLNKINIKEKNGLDYTKELCEGLEIILKFSTDCELIDYKKEFMKEFSIILPDDIFKRMDIVAEKIEEYLPLLRKNNPKLKEAVKKMCISLSALGNAILDYNDGRKQPDDREMPDDDLMIEINDLYFTENDAPGDEYYKTVIKYISILLENFKKSVKEDNREIMQLIGLRIDLQALQLEQLYRLTL